MSVLNIIPLEYVYESPQLINFNTSHEEVLHTVNIYSDISFGDTDYENTEYNLHKHKLMNQFTCFNKKARRTIRKWLLLFIIITILFAGIITDNLMRDAFVGIFYTTISFILWYFITKIPQCIYECFRGYPVPHLLCLEGKKHNRFFLNYK